MWQLAVAAAVAIYIGETQWQLSIMAQYQQRVAAVALAKAVALAQYTAMA
jgi:hypothetical protein